LALEALHLGRELGGPGAVRWIARYAPKARTEARVYAVAVMRGDEGLERHPTESRSPAGRAYLALAAAGFQRYATYRQAMVAAAVTNTVFGFLRFAVMLAVIEGGTRVVAGYDEPQLATFVWAGQGLIGVVLLWSPPDLAERIRTGDVVTDLLRPIDPVWQLLAADLGRAGYAALTRFAVPMVTGALVFDLYAPRRTVTYALFACSAVLATIVCFGCRYLVNASAYWLLDARGPNTFWTLTSGMLGGLYFPVWFLPDAVATALIVVTPFPSVIQIPLDVLVERGSAAFQLGLLGVQAGWVVAILALCRWVQGRGERKLVIQGG
jgi:ABC-2 type transport system permease protein